jgi:hypothetical protein
LAHAIYPRPITLGGDATPLARLRVSAAPFGLAANPEAGRIYAIDNVDNHVWLIEDRRIRGPSARLLARASLPQAPKDGEITLGEPVGR